MYCKDPDCTQCNPLSICEECGEEEYHFDSVEWRCRNCGYSEEDKKEKGYEHNNKT